MEVSCKYIFLRLGWLLRDIPGVCALYMLSEYDTIRDFLLL